MYIKKEMNYEDYLYRLELSERVKSTIFLYLRKRQPTQLLEKIEFYHKSYDYIFNILNDDKLSKIILEQNVFEYIKKDVSWFIRTHRGLSILYPTLKKRYPEVDEVHLVYELFVKHYKKDYNYNKYHRILNFICGYLNDNQIIDFIQKIKKDIILFEGIIDNENE